MSCKHRSFIVGLISSALYLIGALVSPFAISQTKEDALEKVRDLAIEAERTADKASERANNAIDAANRRFDAVEKIFYVLSAMASVFLVGVAVAESRRRKTEQERFDLILRRQDRFDDMAAAAATQQARLVDNQISLGENVLLRSDEVLQKQIETMTKLGAVIKLVEDIFKSRLEQEEGRETLQKELARITRKMDQEAKDAQKQLQDLVITPALSLEELKRTDWPTLGAEERMAAATARTTFRAVSPEIVEEAIKQNRLVIAQVRYLLGVSAYYSNDISEALRLLHSSRKLYEEADPLPPEHRRPAAFCFYYLGLIEKNWWRTGRPIEENFREAVHFLEEADRRHNAPDEFLTPITLIEARSYIETERPNARIRLSTVVSKFNELSEDSLKDIHRSLRQRAYLLLGNLQLFDKQTDNAVASFRKANIWWFGVGADGKKTESTDPDKKEALNPNYFALLSIGQALGPASDQREATESLQRGLRLLVQTGAIDKPELTTRGSNLAWAAIAAHLVADDRKTEYATRFFQAMAHVRKVGDRTPLFFDPLSKTLVTAENLVKAVKTITEA